MKTLLERVLDKLGQFKNAKILTTEREVADHLVACLSEANDIPTSEEMGVKVLISQATRERGGSGRITQPMGSRWAPLQKVLENEIAARERFAGPGFEKDPIVIELRSILKET